MAVEEYEQATKYSLAPSNEQRNADKN